MMMMVLLSPLGPDVSPDQANHHEDSPGFLSHGHGLRVQHGHRDGSEYSGTRTWEAKPCGVGESETVVERFVSL